MASENDKYIRLFFDTTDGYVGEFVGEPEENSLAFRHIPDMNQPERDIRRLINSLAMPGLTNGILELVINPNQVFVQNTMTKIRDKLGFTDDQNSIVLTKELQDKLVS